MTRLTERDTRRERVMSDADTSGPSPLDTST